MKIKKWNGTSWVQDYPEVNIDAIVATGTPSATTYLRGDGTWATVDTDTNTTYSISAVDSANDAIIRLTGSDSTTDDIKLVAGANITLTPSGDNITIAATDTNTTYTLSSFGINATAAELNTLDGITATTTELNYVDGVTSAIQTQLNAKAPLASPALTGTPTATTANNTDNSTRIATTAFVTNKLAGVAGGLNFEGTISLSTSKTADDLYAAGLTAEGDYLIVSATGDIVSGGTLLSLAVQSPGDEGDSTLPVTLETGDWIVFVSNVSQVLTVAIINNTDTRFAPSSHTHDDRYYTETESDSRFFNVSGDTVTGTLNVSSTGSNRATINMISAGNVPNDFYLGSNGSQHWSITSRDSTNPYLGLYNLSTSNWAWQVATNSVMNFYANPTVNGSTIFHDGYHPNADKWTTSRTLSLSGDASGSVSWDGSANATLSVTVADDSHNHTIANVDGLQTALDGKASTSHNHDGTYAYYDHFRSLGTVTLNGGTTTSAIISQIEGWNAFDSFSSMFKGSWSYAGNSDLSDAGRLTELAGTSWLTWTDNSSDSTRGNITALVIAPNTGGSANGVFIYNDQGSSYSPGWREVWTSASDGAGSGLDADLLDGQQGSYYQPASSAITTSNIGSQSVNYASSAGNADTVDSLHASSFIRSDTNDTASGNYSFTGYHTGNTQYYGTDTTGTYSNAPIEIREVNLVTTGQSSSAYAPSIAWHWGGRAQTQMKLYSNGKLNLEGNHTGQVLTTTEGNAVSASKLATARNIALTGDVTGSANFDGSGNISITATVADDSHNHTWSNIDGGSVNGWGGLRHSTSSGYIDFGPANTGTAHIYTDRPSFYFNKELYVLGNQVYHTGYHPEADRWTTARTLSLTGDVTGSVSWSGSADASITTTVADDSHKHNASSLDIPGLWTFRYSTTTTMADPGSGWFRLNNTTQTSATQAVFDDVDYYGRPFDIAGAELNDGAIISLYAVDTIGANWDGDELVRYYVNLVTDGAGYTLMYLKLIEASADAIDANDTVYVRVTPAPKASSTVAGGIKARLNGTTLYLRNDSSDA